MKFFFPMAVQANKATAKTKNGVLTITLPKAKKEQKKRITVEEDK